MEFGVVCPKASVPRGIRVPASPTAALNGSWGTKKNNFTQLFAVNITGQNTYRSVLFDGRARKWNEKFEQFELKQMLVVVSDITVGCYTKT